MTDLEKTEQWFGGDRNAMSMYCLFEALAHTWDDLIDRDKPVNEDQINDAFLSCLVYLPANPFYQRIQTAILPMWVSVVSAYQVANKFEKDKDSHGVEIAHTLRYAAGHIIAYAVHVCVGSERAKEVMPEVWKDIVHERFDAYKSEVIK